MPRAVVLQNSWSDKDGENFDAIATCDHDNEWIVIERINVEHEAEQLCISYEDWSLIVSMVNGTKLEAERIAQEEGSDQ